VPPDDLSEVALEEWRRITDDLDSMGLLSRADRMALVLYVEAFDRYTQMKRSNPVQEYANGADNVSGAYSVMKGEREIMRRLLVEFGLTRAARSRMALPKDTSGSPDVLSFIARKSA